MASSQPSAGFSRRDLLRRTGGLAALAAFAAACGGNTGRSPSGGGGGASGSNVTLEQWYHQYGEKGTKEAAMKYAAAYKEATVKVGWFPGDYGGRLSTGLLSGKGPDVFESQLNVSMVKSNQVAPLDDILADVKDDYTENDIKTNTIDGKTYGVRMIDDPQLIYYRKSLLQKAGVQPPTTVDELIEAAKATSNGKTKGLFAGNDGGLVLGGVGMYSAGGNWLSDDNKAPAFATEQTTALFGKLRELYNSKALLLGPPTDWTDPGAFINELCAMQWIGLWAMPAIQEKWGDDFGVIPFPKADASGRPAVYNGGWTQFVNAKSKNLDAAKAYVKWLWIDQAEYQEDWALSYGFHIPPRKSLAAKAEKLQSGPAADAVKFSQENGMVDNPFWTPKMGTAFGDMMTNIVKKGNDPAKEVATAKTKVEEELKRQS
jgi:multiple sugar transport system substrate-binding protein